MRSARVICRTIPPAAESSAGGSRRGIIGRGRRGRSRGKLSISASTKDRQEGMVSFEALRKRGGKAHTCNFENTAR